MIEPTTWHECAEELSSVSAEFRTAYLQSSHVSGRPGNPEADNIVRSSSMRGVELLRSLAVSLRNNEDFDLVQPNLKIVGLLKNENVAPIDMQLIKQDCGFSSKNGAQHFEGLNLRQALNKIAHANPNNSGVYVSPDSTEHDMILTGNHNRRDWIAVVSISRLIDAVRSTENAKL